MGNIFCIHPSIDCSVCIDLVNDLNIHSGLRIDNNNTPKLISFPFIGKVSDVAVSTYLTDVIQAAKDGNHVIVTSLMAVREELRKRGFTYYLIYPHNNQEVGIDFKHDLTDYKLQLHQGERLEDLLVMNLARSRLGFSRINTPPPKETTAVDGWRSVRELG